MEMVRIDSESGDEARFLQYLIGEVDAMGGHATLDDYGNLIATFDAAACEGVEPILLSCHGDTVKPGVGIEPFLDDGVIRSAGPTILGADDKAVALAEKMAATIRSEVKAAGATVGIDMDEKCRAVQIPEDAWSVRIAKEALATVGIKAQAVSMTGFTDASIYNNRGIEMAVVGIGAQNEHSTDECIEVADMERAVQMLLEIFRLVAAGG